MKTKHQIVADANGTAEHVFNFAKQGFTLMDSGSVGVRFVSTPAMFKSPVARRWKLFDRFLSQKLVLIPTWAWRVEVIIGELKDYLYSVHHSYDFLIIDDDRKLGPRLVQLLQKISTLKEPEFFFNKLLSQCEFEIDAMDRGVLIVTSMPSISDFMTFIKSKGGMQ